MDILVTMPTKSAHFPTFFYPETIERMKKMGNVVFNESDKQFTHEELCEHIKGKDVVMTGWGSPCVDEDVLKHADKLKYFAHTAGSVTNFLCEEVYNRGIKVLGGNEFFAESVAESCLAYMLSSLRMIPFHAHLVSYERGWRDPNVTRSEGLYDKTVGIVSFGAISRYLIKLLKPFHVKIKLYSRKALPQDYLDENNIEQVSLEDVFRLSDIVSIQTAQNPQTVGMIKAEHFALMKDDALFINTARGSVVDEEALLNEIKKDRLYFVLDVFHEEPPISDIYYGRKRVIMQPHKGGPTVDRRHYMTEALLTDIENDMAGKPTWLDIPWEVAKNMTNNDVGKKKK